MSGRFSVYESPSSQRFSTILKLNGAASKEDDLFVTKLLSTFVNKQSALFQRWVKVRITENNNGFPEFTRYTSNNSQIYGSKHPKSQLLVLTPLKIISLPTIQSPKRMKQFKIIDIISLFIEENTQSYHSPSGTHLNVKKKHKSAKKLNKPKKRTISNNTKQIQVIQTKVNDPNSLLTVSTPKKKKKKRDKILTSYPIVQYKPDYIQHENNNNNTHKKTQNIKILDKNGHHSLLHRGHHPQASSSSQSHSLSPPPSTSLPSFNDFAVTDEYHNEDMILYESNLKTEPSRSHSTSYQNRSQSRSNASTITSLGGYTGWIYHCSIKFHKLDVLDMSYDKLLSHNYDSLETDILDIYFEAKDVAKEFLDILQFYLFTLYRGVPREYKPKCEIIPNALNDDEKYLDNNMSMSSDDDMKNNTRKKPKVKKQKYPFVPSQVFIDRYVAYCDAQKIQALDCVIDYVIHTNNDDIFDVAAAFSHQYRNGSHHPIARSDEVMPILPVGGTKLGINYSSLDNFSREINNGMRQTKNIQQEQYVALGHALAFLKMYKKLCVDRLNTDDSNIATLMKIFETNPYISACEFRKCAIKKITMQSLSISLRAGVSNLKELSIIDIHLSRSVLRDLDLENCNLNKLVMSKCNMSEKTCVYLFNELMQAQQHKTMIHLNISHNHCDKEGTKGLSNFIYQTLNIQTLIVHDARIDGNIFFNGLHINNYNNVGIKHHLQCLLYLDFSGNFIGDSGARKLSNFVQCAQALQCLKLSRCNMSSEQLHKIFEGALANNSGLQYIQDNEDLDELILEENDEDLEEKKSDTSVEDHSVVADNDIISYNELLRSKSAGTTTATVTTSTASMSASPLHFISRKNTITQHQSQNNNVLLAYRPTRCDIIQCRELMRLTLDLSYNNLSAKGSHIICQLLQNRLFGGNIGNYTIVSLSLAGNNFDIITLSKILNNLHCCICLESLNISDNITKPNIFRNNNFGSGIISKKNKLIHKSKKKNKKEDRTKAVVTGPNILGHSLVNLCGKATKLERLIFNTNDLSVGLAPFLSGIACLSNLKFIDLSNNKFNDKHIELLITSLSYNRTFIRALKISNNKISQHCLIEYLQLLSNHTSLIDVNTCLPREHIIKYKKIKKYSATFTRLQNEASLNLRGNKFQYDIDKKMVSSLPIRERLEKVLRLQCGEQFGIPLECVRGTIKFVDYASRIPKILIHLRNYLKAKGGFKSREIFRFSADSTQFNKFKQDLNANNKCAKTDDTHSIANAIKAFYHDLPVKVLNNVNITILSSCKHVNDIPKVIRLIKEPYKSLFEWLLDLCVDIVIREKINKMSHRSMAVVLCPSLYNAFTAAPTSKILRSVMEFTDFAIQHRILYRKNNKTKYEEEFIQDPNDNNENSLQIQRRSNILNGHKPYQEQINKWNSVMKNLNEQDIEQQSWNNCKNPENINMDESINTFCYCIDRLTFVLQYYKKWLIKRNINPHRQSTATLTITKEINKYNHRIIDFIQSLSNYNNVQLINDFNHILRYHSSDDELEHIMNNLREAMGGNACVNISQCTCMKRNNRNRDQDENRPWKMKIYFGYKQSEEICTQQILDKIHCYFFHTFDTLRLSTEERQRINEIKVENEIIPSRKSTSRNQPKQDRKYVMLKKILTPKSEKLIQIRGVHRIKGTKFSSNMSLFVQRINNNQTVYMDDELDEEDEDEEVYKLGQTFDYFDGSGGVSVMNLQGDQGKKDANNNNNSSSTRGWYINKKYNNFKEELLHNNILQIACDSWNDTYFKALILQKSSIAKHIKYAAKSITPHTPNSPTPMPPSLVSDSDDNSARNSPKNTFMEMKEEEEWQTMSIQHLMAVLLYCDFDNLRFKLNATFYPQSMNETVSNWKLRNAEYCHWTQYLRDAVMNCNGIDMGTCRNANVLYHSSTNQTFLSPKYVKFCYPMSCNKHLSIMHTFSPRNGIIFALKCKDNNVSHFNCNWISDYANYDEKIIFGTSKCVANIFEINNIINIETCCNYKSFWNAINILYCIINGNDNHCNYNEQDMHCLSLLIQSQIFRDRSDSRTKKAITMSKKLIPNYIQALFSSFCRDYILGQITLNPSHFIAIPMIYKHLFDEFGWIKIDLFCNLFINISSIKIINVILNENIFECIYKFLLQFFNNQANTKRRGAISAMQKRKSSVLELIGSQKNNNNSDSNAANSSSANHIISHSSLSLTAIQFINVDEKYISCKQSVHRYKQNLNDIGWNIKYIESCLYINKQ